MKIMTTIYLIHNIASLNPSTRMKKAKKRTAVKRRKQRLQQKMLLRKRMKLMTKTSKNKMIKRRKI